MHPMARSPTEILNHVSKARIKELEKSIENTNTALPDCLLSDFHARKIADRLHSELSDRYKLMLVRSNNASSPKGMFKQAVKAYGSSALAERTCGRKSHSKAQFLCVTTPTDESHYFDVCVTFFFKKGHPLSMQMKHILRFSPHFVVRLLQRCGLADHNFTAKWFARVLLVIADVYAYASQEAPEVVVKLKVDDEIWNVPVEMIDGRAVAKTFWVSQRD